MILRTLEGLAVAYPPSLISYLHPSPLDSSCTVSLSDPYMYLSPFYHRAFAQVVPPVRYASPALELCQFLL